MIRASSDRAPSGGHFDVTIRALTLADRAQLDRLAEESVAAGFQFIARWRAAIEMSSTALNVERQFFLGVFDGDVLLGVGGVTPDPYDTTVDLGRVRHVYVSAASRRRGVGRLLLAALEARACATSTALRLRTDTASAAAFYEALGHARIDDARATHYRTLLDNATY